MNRKEQRDRRQERGDLAAKLYTEDQTLTINDVALQLGVSRTTIWRDLRDRNVQMRPTPDQYRQQRIAQQMVRRAEKRRAKIERRREWEERRQEWEEAREQRAIMEILGFGL